MNLDQKTKNSEKRTNDFLYDKLKILQGIEETADEASVKSSARSQSTGKLNEEKKESDDNKVSNQNNSKNNRENNVTDLNENYTDDSMEYLLIHKLCKTLYKKSSKKKIGLSKDLLNDRIVEFQSSNE